MTNSYFKFIISAAKSFLFCKAELHGTSRNLRQAATVNRNKFVGIGLLKTEIKTSVTEVLSNRTEVTG